MYRRPAARPPPPRDSSLGGELHGLAFLIELLFLKGQSKLPGENVFSVRQYE